MHSFTLASFTELPQITFIQPANDYTHASTKYLIGLIFVDGLALIMLCSTCTVHFPTRVALLKHQQSMRHCFCNRCATSFSTSQDFKKHREIPHTKVCGFCTLSFQWLDELRLHQRKWKHGFCQGCDRYYGSPDDYWEHLESPSHVFRCLCRCCGKGFSFQYELDKHVLRHVPRYSCYGCRLYFKDRRLVFQHCCHCGRVLKGQSQINRHCCVCGRVLGAQLPIDRHCCGCGRTHKGHVALEQYLQDQHYKPSESRSKPTAAKANSVCHCEYKFVHTVIPAQHLGNMVYTRPGSPPAPKFGMKVACQECGRAFALKADLKQHRDHTRHQRTDDVISVPCQECRRTFACRADLQNHQKATGHEHSEVLNYSASHVQQDAPAPICVACKKCCKAFACEADLQRHQQSLNHHGVSDLIPVACGVCQKAFIHKEDLQSHQKALKHKPSAF